MVVRLFKKFLLWFKLADKSAKRYYDVEAKLRGGL
jgi:hypothetical protein